MNWLGWLRRLQFVAVLGLCLLAATSCQLIFGDVDVVGPGETPAVCVAGEFRCNEEYLLSCGKAGWSLAETCPTAERCDSRNERCTRCKDGDYRCDGAAWETCNPDGSGWRELGRCGSPELCSPSGCGPCKTPGELQCSGAEGRELRRCNNRQLWELVDTCVSASLCTNSIDRAMAEPGTWSGACEPPACSEPGRYTCDGARLLRCPQDQTTFNEVDVCANAALCALRADEANRGATAQNGATTDMCPGVCPSAGAFRCDGMQLQRCRADLTGWEPIGEACVAPTECNPALGACTQMCTPGEYQCNDRELRRCANDRTWQIVEECKTAALCSASQTNGTWRGECRPPSCPVAGDFRCEGAQLLECSTDLTAWEARGTCASAALCNAASKRCDPLGCPIAGELRCFEQELRQCNADLTAWVPPLGRTEPLVCQAGQFCDNNPVSPGCKTACSSATRCNGAVLERCTAEEGWRAQATCATSALCACTLEDPDGAGPRTNACALGVGENGCGVPLCGGSTGPQYQCAVATLQSCQSGRNGWDTAEVCATADRCYPGVAPTYTGGYCAACSVAGEVQCAASSPPTLRTCSANRRSWTITQTCTGDCLDSGSADYCAVCAAGQAQCSNGTLQVCATDRRGWNNTPCPNPTLCDAPNQQCDNCRAGSVECGSDQLRRCSADGQTVQSMPCPANRCDAVQNECDVCVPNATWCVSEAVFQCSADGRTQTQIDSCASAQLCAGGVCTPPACAVGQRRCSATGQPQVCNTNRTAYVDDGTPCETAALCAAGTCNPPACEAAQRSCLGAQPAVCNPGRTEFVATTDPPCATAALCASGACTPPTCMPMQPGCAGAQPVVCNADQNGWMPVGEPCASVPLCNTTTGSCRACVPNARRCVEGQPQVCNAAGTAWVDDGPPCVPASLCDAASGSCLTCQAGSRRCNGAQPQICDDAGSAWLPNGEACSRAALCNNTTGACMLCEPDTRRCLEGQPQVCNPSGSGWQDDGPACATPALCTAGTGTCRAPACEAGAAECVTRTNVLRVCRADRTDWMETPCGAGICDAAGRECDDCSPPTPSNPVSPVCNGNSVRTCDMTGHWSDAPCGETMVCMDGECVMLPPPPTPP